MGSKKSSKPLDEELIEKATLRAEGHAKQAGGKLLDHEIESNLTEFESESGRHIKGFKESLKHGISSYQLTLHSTVFFLLAAQLSISFLLLLFLYVFSFILALVLVWVVMFVGIIYCAAYCLISRYPHHFKKSSLSFMTCVVLAISEGIVLCFMSMPISTMIFLIEVSILILALLCTCIFAKAKKEEYNVKTGLVVTLGATVVLFVIFVAAFSEHWIWLTACTCCMAGYEWFLVSKVSSVIEKIAEEEGEDNFQAGVYASLLIFKSKIDLFVNIGVWAVRKCCKPKTEPETNDTEL